MTLFEEYHKKLEILNRTQTHEQRKLLVEELMDLEQNIKKQYNI